MPNWRLFAVVTVGGGLGSAARLLLGALVQQRVPVGFPAGTFLINVTGSFLIGVFSQIGVDTRILSPEARFFLTTGLCGGFTTFSTFSYETLQLVEEDQYGTAAAYVTASVVVSLIACALGIAAARGLLAWRRT
ncbi:MAG: fluoride efflux transporter CrcB [Gemmatimonadaceae bacterium]